MPNWCSTKFVFTGNAQDITDIYNKITEYTSSSIGKSDFGNCWLGNVLIGFGFGDKIDSKTDRLRCRGSITDIGEIEDYYDSFSFEFWTDTAWCPMVRMWNEIIAKHYDNRISVSWLAEEPGCCLYETNDMDMFGHDRYWLEWSLEEHDEWGTDYCSTAEAAADIINNLIAKYNLDIESVTAEHIRDLENCGKDCILSGDDWSITCIPLIEVNDADMD